MIPEKEVTISERIARLFSVKSSVTIILTLVFSYLSIMGKVNPEQFMTIFVVIIAFYFGTQAMKE